MLAIMGSSGAGKSTLLNTLLFRNLGSLKVALQPTNLEPIEPLVILREVSSIQIKPQGPQKGKVYYDSIQH